MEEHYIKIEKYLNEFLTSFDTRLHIQEFLGEGIKTLTNPIEEIKYEKKDSDIIDVLYSDFDQQLFENLIYQIKNSKIQKVIIKDHLGEIILSKEFFYNSNGNIETITINKSIFETKIQHIYNNKNQIEQKIYTYNSPDVVIEKFYYLHNKHIATLIEEQFSEVQPSQSIDLFSYDSNNRIISEKNLSQEGESYQTDFRYDDKGRIKEMSAIGVDFDNVYSHRYENLQMDNHNIEKVLISNAINKKSDNVRVIADIDKLIVIKRYYSNF